MIEKLVTQKLTIAGKKYEYPDTTEVVGKINELVDAVNSLRDDCNLLMGYIAPEDKCEAKPTDLYAKQRKWIGKLCKFWDYENNVVYGVLEDVDSFIGDNNVEYALYKNGTNGNNYFNCEPVSPDNNIIYI